MLGLNPAMFEQPVQDGSPTPAEVKLHAQEALGRIQKLFASSPKRDPNTGLVIRDSENGSAADRFADRFGTSTTATGTGSLSSDHSSLASRAGGWHPSRHGNSPPDGGRTGAAEEGARRRSGAARGSPSRPP